MRMYWLAYPDAIFQINSQHINETMSKEILFYGTLISKLESMEIISFLKKNRFLDAQIRRETTYSADKNA